MTGQERYEEFARSRAEFDRKMREESERFALALARYRESREGRESSAIEFFDGQ